MARGSERHVADAFLARVEALLRPAPTRRRAPHRTGRRAAAPRHPFEPLLALWSLGYALRGSSRTPLALVALLPEWRAKHPLESSAAM